MELNVSLFPSITTTEPTVTSGWISAGVIVALIIFVARIAYENKRQRTADANKVSGVKTILARFCRENRYPARRVKRIADKASELVSSENDLTVTVERSATGLVMLRFKSVIAKYERWSNLPEFRIGQIEFIMLEVAKLDRDLLRKTQNAYEAVADLEEVRGAMIDWFTEKSEVDKKHLFFARYELMEEIVNSSIRDLEKLYLECTGEALHVLRKDDD